MIVNEAINSCDLGGEPKILAWASVSCKMDYLSKCQSSQSNEVGFMVPEHLGDRRVKNSQGIRSAQVRKARKHAVDPEGKQEPKQEMTKPQDLLKNAPQP